MKKHLGLILVIIGVGIAALYGARNPASFDDIIVAKGTRDFSAMDAAATWTAFCDAAGVDTEDEAALGGCMGQAPGMPAAMADADDPTAVVDNWQAALEKAPDQQAWTVFVAATADPAEATTAWLAYCEVIEGGAACAEAQPAYAPLPEEGAPEATALRIAVDAAATQDAEAWTNWVTRTADMTRAGMSIAPPTPGARLGEWFSLAGFPFLLGIALIAGGGVLARAAIRKEASGDNDAAGDTRQSTAPRDLGEVLDKLVEESAALAERIGDAQRLEAAEIDEVKDAIDALKLGSVDPIVAVRERIIARYGMAGFAAFFGPVSAGERKLNRAWSALVDEHPPEARDSLSLAGEHFASARKEIDALAET